MQEDVVSASRKSSCLKNILPETTSAADPKQLEFFQCQWKVGSSENVALITGVSVALAKFHHLDSVICSLQILRVAVLNSTWEKGSSIMSISLMSSVREMRSTSVTG